MSILDAAGAISYWPVAVVVSLVVFVVIYSPGPIDGAPPIVPYRIPWVGSLLALRQDPDGFLESAMRRYGNIFGVYSAGQTMYYVTSAELMNSVYHQSKKFVLSPMQFEWMTNIFGLSWSATHGSSTFGEKIMPLMHRLLAPVHVGDIVWPFAKRANDLLHEQADSLAQSRSPTRSMSLLSLTHTLVFDSAAYALFGPTFPASAFLPDFQIFDESVPLLGMGFPSDLLPLFVSARSRLVARFENYLSTPYEPSKLISGTEALAREAKWSNRDVSSLFLATLWPLQANSPYAIFWLLLLLLQSPEGLAPLVEEIDTAHIRWQLRNPDKDLTSDVISFICEEHLPLLTAAIQETLRFATCSFSIRCVEAPTVQLGGCELRRGDHVVCYTRSLHMEESFFSNAETFKSDRFEGTTPGRQTYFPFGGGISQCEGRHLALAQIRIFIVLLLTYLHVELDGNADPGYKEGQRGFGMLRPKRDVQVIVSARETSI